MIGILIYIMPMLEPKELEMRRQKRVHQQHNRRRHRRWPAVLLVLVAIYVTVVSVIPVAQLSARADTIGAPSRPAVSLAWPRYGQAAVGAVGFGKLAESGEQKPLPIASVAKVITALAVLKHRPIAEGQPPAVLTMNAEDEALYYQYLAEGQSHVAVESGQQLTQYQALQALLLPSANNMAEALTRWAFGSTQEYLDFVNPFTKTIGMKNTTIADASGFSPQTVSTAADLVLLAEIAMDHPVISDIVSQAEADLPGTGRIYNVNNLLGHQGVNGIKTGNTDEAGGCYLFSAKREVDGGHTATIVGAIMGAPDRSQAINDSLPVMEDAFRAFAVIGPVRTGQIVGRIDQAGGGHTNIVVGRGLTELAWGDHKPTYDIKLNNLNSYVAQSEEVGQLTVSLGNMTHTVPLVAEQPLAKKSFLWRIRHAAGYL